MPNGIRDVLLGSDLDPQRRSLVASDVRSDRPEKRFSGKVSFWEGGKLNQLSFLEIDLANSLPEGTFPETSFQDLR